MHRILERQIKRAFGEHVTESPQWNTFITLISNTYTHLDEDRALLDRSLDLSSKEFSENKQHLEQTRKQIEDQAKNLAGDVAARTKTLGERVTELEDVRRAMSNLLEDMEMQKIREESLVKDLEKFKLAVDNTSDQVLITDADGIVIYGNSSVEKNTGYTVAEIFGKKAGSLWKKPMSTEYYQKLWDTLKNKKKEFKGEIENKRKNGELYIAEIRISPVLDTHGNIIYFVGIERDITKEKEVENAKTEFVSIASHELRTPLTAIDGLVSMILDGEYGKVNDNLRPPLTDVNASSERLIDLVNDMLNLSRIQAGKLKYVISDVRLADVIAQTVHLLQPLSDKKGLRLIADGLDQTHVKGDSDRIKEVLNNLIGNSLKFTDNGTITVSIKVNDKTVETYIADTGIGITKQDQDKLFGQFQQIETGKGNVGGTGLGLHISREMARKMGGDVWLANSQVGVGSTFAFSIPK